MWLCTNWVYNANELAAWGTWAAVLVALFGGLVAYVRSWLRLRVERRLLAVLLFHEVAHAKVIVETLKEKVIDAGGGYGLAELLIATEPTLRKELVFDIKRLQLTALEHSADRIGILPKKTAIAVVELRSGIDYLHQAGQALDSEARPPKEFFVQFRGNIRTTLASATEARDLLIRTGFPNGRMTMQEALEHDAADSNEKAPEGVRGLRARWASKWTALVSRLKSPNGSPNIAP